MKIASDTDFTVAIAQLSPPSQAAPTPSGSFGAVLRGTMSDAGAPAATEELSGMGVMERAVDAEGAYVEGLFRMRYADGTYSGARNVFEIDVMRRKALAGEAPEATLSKEGYTADVEAKVLRNDDALSVVDIEGGSAERYGNDMVALNFRDGTRRITQKALYEAAANLGAFDAITTQREFAEWHLNDWAPGVVADATCDTAIVRADPTIVARKLIAAAAYAPESEAVRSATKSEIEPSAVLAQPGTAQAGPRATPLPETSEISVDTAATSLTEGVEADIQ